MKIEKRHFIWSVALLTVMYSCSDGAGNSGTEGEDFTEESTEEADSQEPKKVVYYATPSLVDVATLMKESGATFSDKLLNDPSKGSSYSTHYKRAINMGVYGADLTYCAMFDETQKSINYLKTVKEMSQELGLDGAFEADLLASIESNITDRDALLDVITDFYWSADAFLTDNDRVEVSSLIITGGWVESMFLACDMANRHPENEIIRQRIAEQKLILKNLLLFLEAGASEDKNVAECIKELKELQGVYNTVEVKQGSGNSITDAQKGETVVGNETEVKISQSQLNDLCNILTRIRKRYVEN